MNKKSFGVCIKEAREKRGLTREQVARRLKLSPTTIGHFEWCPVVPVSDKRVVDLANVLHVSAKKLDTLVKPRNKYARSWMRGRMARKIA